MWHSGDPSPLTAPPFLLAVRLAAGCTAHTRPLLTGCVCGAYMCAHCVCARLWCPRAPQASGLRPGLRAGPALSECGVPGQADLLRPSAGGSGEEDRLDGSRRACSVGSRPALGGGAVIPSCPAHSRCSAVVCAISQSCDRPCLSECPSCLPRGRAPAAPRAAAVHIGPPGLAVQIRTSLGVGCEGEPRSPRALV